MSEELELDVDKLLGQLENYASKGLDALGSAKQEIAELEARNAQLNERVAQLETNLASLGARLTQALENPLEADLLSRSDSLMVMIKETLGVSKPGEAQKSIPSAASELDKLNPQQRLQHWIKTYPRAFMPGQPQPLKIGIHEELLAVEGGDMKKIRRALASYVKVPRYLRCMKTGAVRLDLKGNNAGFVTQEEAEFASEHLQKLEDSKKQRDLLKKQQDKERQENLKASRLQNKLSALVEMNKR
ncbi:ProQ/FINO family protein [Marinospirillum insulare]|uniref:ProQ/FinO domain-containing protein n=1 Tax=Marinospirillum insulare TaxID=217169 RepID=A0ABQ5ZXB2_9GAMM|nr:ProQ/FINO family protein [Marinospirillum insulare]GLR63642.1 hypothetical protein GCM10007878_10770 [Marinospirillum insulare]